MLDPGEAVNRLMNDVGGELSFRVCRDMGSEYAPPFPKKHNDFKVVDLRPFLLKRGGGGEC